MNDSATGVEPSAGPPADSAETALRKVLVVDDDPAMRRLVSKILESAGYEVLQAGNGAEALEAVREELPAFVITDLDMPVLDGIGFCRMVRDEELPHYVYVLILTGSCGDHLVEGLTSGADDFLRKPVKPLELLARMQSGARILDLEERLRVLATRDSLTGLLNRRTFFELLEKEWLRSRRICCPLSCVMSDVDLFKRVNDTYGHAVGDAVLKSVSRLIEGCCRGSDSVCRYGGEEFCVLLPDTDDKGAASWAERCRLAIAETPCVAGGRSTSVTVSLGVAQREETTESPEQLLDRADQALLAAKRQGRNRVVAYRSLG